KAAWVVPISPPRSSTSWVSTTSGSGISTTAAKKRSPTRLSAKPASWMSCWREATANDRVGWPVNSTSRDGATGASPLLGDNWIESDWRAVVEELLMGDYVDPIAKGARESAAMSTVDELRQNVLF